MEMGYCRDLVNSCRSEKALVSVYFVVQRIVSFFSDRAAVV
jgi:hypothetical protein